MKFESLKFVIKILEFDFYLNLFKCKLLYDWQKSDWDHADFCNN